MQSMPKMRITYRWVLCLLLCFASGVSIHAAEVLIYDGTFTTTAGDHGFAYFHASPASGMDWLAPADLYEGQWHIRYEVLDYPSGKPFQLSVCIWADVVREDGKWKTWHETCARRTPISGKGVFTDVSSPADWWCLKGEPVDFARVGDFEKLGLVVWSADGRNVSDWVPDNESSWDQAKDFLPLTVRLTLVGVTKGSTFSGWDRYLVCPLSWHYIHADDHRAKWGDFDDPSWLRYFGLDAGDMDGDGDLDLVSGQYVYRNPGGDLTGPWQRTDLGGNIDGMLTLDVDGDAHPDVIATALPDVFWCEAKDETLDHWERIRIGTVPKTGHVNGQGYGKADLDGNGEPEVLLSAAGGIYAARIPENPAETSWSFLHVVARGTDEGFAVADMDGDGDLDLIGGDGPPGDEHPTIVAWWENPGRWQGDWARHEIGHTIHAVDRVAAADFNGDGRPDIAISEERSPGKEPDGHLWWFEATASGPTAPFTRHLLIQQYSMNNLDAGDLDNDGAVDLVTCEHKGPYLRLQWWRNDGSGNFVMYEIDRGKEGHLGARLFDLDEDGDLDIVNAAWDRWEDLHIWRTDTKAR